MKIYFDGTLIDSDNYISFSNEFKQFDETFMLGTTASNTITIEVPGNIAIPTNVLIKINNSNYSTMIVDSYEYEDNNILKLNLVDKMVLLDFNYNAQSIVPCTAKAILQDICTQAGITLATTSFTNESLSIDYYDNTITAREYVGMIAELNGGFARINTDGELELVKFTETPTNIDIDTCEDFRVGEKHKIERVVFDNGLLKFETSSDETKETLYLNSLNVYINDETTFNNIANQILNFEFYCFSTGNCEIKSNVRAGDLINFTDGTNNYPTIAQYSLNYIGGLNGGYELNINSKKQEETKIVGVGEQYKRLRVDLNRDENQLTILAGKTENIEKEINPTDTASGSSIYLEDSAETELIDFELEGKTGQDGEPTPNNPIELVSVGYENLLGIPDVNYSGYGITIKSTNGVITISGTATETFVYNFDLISLISSSLGTLTKSLNASGTFSGLQTSLRNNDGNNVGLWTTDAQNLTNTISADAYKFRIQINSGITINTTIKPQIQKGTQAHSYIPYGKYGVEVKTNGKNLFSGFTKGIGLSASNGSQTTNSNGATSNFIKVDFNTNPNYYLSDLTDTLSSYVASYNSNKEFLGRTPATHTTFWSLNATRFTSGTPQGTGEIAYLRITTYKQSSDTGSIDDIDNLQTQLEIGTQATAYEEYKSNTYLYTLDNPLRSIGDTKDLLYIKNGMLYVDRKIGKVVLNGSENWQLRNTSTNGTKTYSLANPFDYKRESSNGEYAYSNYFVANKTVIALTEMYNDLLDVIGISFYYNNTNSTRALYINTTETLPVWLSTHNTEVQYVLAEPYTEELGSVDMPSTYRGITYLNTIDELEPNMNITYVRDTIIANYVESHVSELKINEKSIETKVSEVEATANGASQVANSIEGRMTSTEATLDIVSTNIDRTTGEVREVTTTNGFTFNSSGMNIHTSENSFNTQISNERMQHKNGDEVITETSKDGFMTTDLRQKNQHFYGWDGQEYNLLDEETTVDGEECYATFWNGSD